MKSSKATKLNIKNILEIFSSFDFNKEICLLGDPLSIEEIRHLQGKNGIRLPVILKEFYLMHNGLDITLSKGTPHQRIVPFQNCDQVHGEFCSILHNALADDDLDKKDRNLLEKLLNPRPENSFFTFGMDSTGDVYYLDLRERTRAGIPVYLLQHGDPFSRKKLADSLENFILDYLEREWAELIADNALEYSFVPDTFPKGKTPAENVELSLEAPLKKGKTEKPAVKDKYFKIAATLSSSNWRHSNRPDYDDDGILSAIFTPEGNLMTGGLDGYIHIWDATTGNSMRNFYLEEKVIHNIILTPDRRRLAVLAGDSYWEDEKSIVVLDFASGKILKEIKAEEMKSVLLSEDGKTLYYLFSGRIQAVNMKDYAKLWNLKPKNGTISAFAVSPQKKYIATYTSDECNLSLWDHETRKKLGDYPQPEGAVRFIYFENEGSLTAIHSHMQTVNVNDFESQSMSLHSQNK